MISKNIDSTDAVFNGFASTKYGDLLSKQLRYDKYNTGGISPSGWIKLLGPDVNNLTHLLETRNLARDFCKITLKKQPDLLNSSDCLMLELAAVIHDQAEAVVGDISYSDKTIAHEANEARIFKTYSSEYNPNVSAETLKMIEKAIAEIVFTSKTRLGKIFNVIERMGYVKVALIASKRLDQSYPNRTKTGLGWLVADVLLNQIEALISVASRYHACEEFLHSNRAQISEAFKKIRDDYFLRYSSAQKLEKQKNFKTSKELWQRWVS